jgi:hypothetical protein
MTILKGDNMLNTIKQTAPVCARRLGVASRARRWLGLASVLLLSACGGSTSDDIAQRDSLETSLAKCEVLRGGVVGTSIPNVQVDGVSTQACLLNKDAGQVGTVSLKDSHQYKPLVWVLEGRYDIGQSKEYNSLAELQADTQYGVGGPTLLAKPGTVVVVHRNGGFSGAISSMDNGHEGTGEWGGVVVNSMGYHPDCGAGEAFCNIEGPWGYYGGLSKSASEAVTNITLSTTNGFSGSITEAGGAVGEPAAEGASIEGQPLPAALIINAALRYQTIAVDGVFNSATDGLWLNGGYLSSGPNMRGHSGHALRLSHGASVVNSIIQHVGASAAVLLEQGGSADAPSRLSDLTVVDSSLAAGTAFALGGGGSVSLNNVAVQGFNACLQVTDAQTALDISNGVFYCNNTSLPADSGTDHAQLALSEGSNVYTLNPDLTNGFAINNSAIVGIQLPSFSVSTKQPFAYNLSLTYPACYGVGVDTGSTVIMGESAYNVCELSGNINKSFYFDKDINGKKIAWRIKGAVSFGTDLHTASEASQLTRLSKPLSVVLDTDSRLLLADDSAITLHAGVKLTAKGSVAQPIVLSTTDETRWGGISLNGLADSCASAEVCELAQQQFIDVQYLHLYKAGKNQPVLSLNQLSAADQLHYIDISNAANDAVVVNGGAANIRNLLTSKVAGSQFSWSNGYRGTLQYAILQSGDSTTGYGLHGINNSSNHDASPRAKPVMANITLIGAENANTGILLEQGSGLLLYKAVVTDYSSCLDIDDPATAALQSSDPAEIYFDEVVLDCVATLAADNENGGSDYGIDTKSRSTVYEVAAGLDINLVPSGGDVPGASGNIDFSLAGDAANYLNAEAGYFGAVANSDDKWYQNWSESVGFLLAEECNLLGVLEKGYTLLAESQNGVNHYYKVCGLRGTTLTEDTLLSYYTGKDAEAAAIDGKVSEELADGSVVEWTPARTIWLLSGVVRVGEGHRELNDLAQVAEMKANPVTLSMEAGALVTFAEDAVLHITRGGALHVNGGEYYNNAPFGEVRTTGPVNMHEMPPSGLPLSTAADRFKSTSSNKKWAHRLVVDGFARHNQCPDALAEPGGQICNIQGEFGYYGGYEEQHNNLQLSNLNFRGMLRLNAVGGGSFIENLAMAPGNPEIGQSERPLIDIDGGRVKFRNVDSNYNFSFNYGLLRWNHGYQGSIQFLSSATYLSSLGAPIVGEDGLLYDPSAITGMNVSEGEDVDAQPRSMPLISNMTLYSSEYFENSSTYSAPIGLARGTGLHLHNSVLGGTDFDYSYGSRTDFCLKIDASVEALIGTELRINQLAVGCKAMASSSANNALAAAFTEKLVGNPVAAASAYSDASTIANPSQASVDIYRFDRIIGAQISKSYSYLEDSTVLGLRSNWNYPASAVMNLGAANAVYDEQLDTSFIQETSYFGAADYFLPLAAGATIKEQ